jgi:hypothetical protein
LNWSICTSLYPSVLLVVDLNGLVAQENDHGESGGRGETTQQKDDLALRGGEQGEQVRHSLVLSALLLEEQENREQVRHSLVLYALLLEEQENRELVRHSLVLYALLLEE